MMSREIRNMTKLGYPPWTQKRRVRRSKRTHPKDSISSTAKIRFSRAKARSYPADIPSAVSKTRNDDLWIAQRRARLAPYSALQGVLMLSSGQDGRRINLQTEIPVAERGAK